MYGRKVRRLGGRVTAYSVFSSRRQNCSDSSHFTWPRRDGQRELDALISCPEGVAAWLAERVFEEHDDDLLGEGDVRERVPDPRQDLDEQQEQHQDDVLPRHGHGEHDDEHGEVEGSCVPPGGVPHLHALRLGTEQKASRHERHHVADHVEHGEGGDVLGGGAAQESECAREGEHVAEAAADAEADQPLGVRELRAALGAGLDRGEGVRGASLRTMSSWKVGTTEDIESSTREPEPRSDCRPSFPKKVGSSLEDPNIWRRRSPGEPSDPLAKL